MTCAVDGCDRRPERRGYCDPHYRRVHKTGDAGVSPIRKQGPNVRPIFPLPADENGCWIWIGEIREDGYGRWRSGVAHRMVWEELRGPIPDGLQLDHLCRVTACVNPDHLEPVTQAENMRRRYASYTHCKAGHEFSPENTHEGPAGRRICRACTRERSRRYRAKRRGAS